ncbi:MAG: GntR family transcriptional regulator [Clostridium sp.]|nr:GntR family transcriptional regulator [Clostridium sp.]
MINKYSNEPLYSQLKKMIVSKIKNGEYPPGSKIPSEQEFCECYDISRPTVRQAISELTNSGYLYRMRGKGTFVLESRSAVHAKTYTGFTDSILDNDADSEQKLISIGELTNKELPKLGGIFSVRSNQIISFAHIKYTSKIDGDLVSLNTSYIPLNLFPNIAEDVRNKKPSYDILRGKYPLVPANTKSCLEVVYTQQNEAQLLKVPEGQPLIKISNTILSKSGQVVEYVISKYKADKCKLLFENSK